MNWKGETLDFLLGWGVPIAGCMLQVLLVARPNLRYFASLRFRWAGPMLLALSRISLYVFLYGILGYASTGDYRYWYEAHATRVLEGQVPGRDFPNGYGILLPVVQALGTLCMPHGNPMGVLLPFILGDIIAAFVLSHMSINVSPSGRCRWLWLWLLLSPLLWYGTLLRGQDEPLFVAFLLVALSLGGGGKYFLCGFVLGFGLLTTKVSFLPYAAGLIAAIFGVRRSLFQMLAGGVSVVGCGAAVSLILRAPLIDLRMIQAQGVFFGTGIGIPDLFARLLPAGNLVRLLVGLPYLAALFLIFYRAARRTADSPSLAMRMLATITLVHSVTMVLAPCCLPPYLVQGSAIVLLFLVENNPSRVVTGALLGLSGIDLLGTLWWHEIAWLQKLLPLLSIPLHLVVSWWAWKALCGTGTAQSLRVGDGCNPQVVHAGGAA